MDRERSNVFLEGIPTDACVNTSAILARGRETESTAKTAPEIGDPPMFLTARILFLNEADYIQYVIRSVYPAVDCIVLVEGCIREYGQVLSGYTEDGLSTDGSGNLVTEFMACEDPDSKIRYLPHGFAENYAALANVALEYFPKETTHFLNIDADEVYAPHDVEQVKALFEVYL